MTITTLSSREFQQDTNQAHRRGGPVFITNRGRSVHVVLSYEEYQRITGRRRIIVEALSMPGRCVYCCERACPRNDGRNPQCGRFRPDGCHRREPVELWH